MAKKKVKQLKIDTSTIDAVKGRIFKEAIQKARVWNDSLKFTQKGMAKPKNLNSILAKAQVKSEKIAQELEAKRQRKIAT